MKMFVVLFVATGTATLGWLFRDVLGWQFALGFGLGGSLFYCLFRWHYGWWPDFESELPHITR